MPVLLMTSARNRLGLMNTSTPSYALIARWIVDSTASSELAARDPLLHRALAAFIADPSTHRSHSWPWSSSW